MNASFLIFSLLNCFCAVFGSRINSLSNLVSLASVKTENDYFNYMVQRFISKKGILMEGSHLETLIKNGNLLECTTIFEANMTFFISNMRLIRSQLKNDHFYRNILVTLCKSHLDQSDHYRVALELCELYKEYPGFVHCGDFKLDYPHHRKLIAFNVQASLVLKNFKYVKFFVEREIFDLNAEVTNQGFKGNAVLLLPDAEAVSFALHYGLDFNALVLTPEGEEITTLSYFAYHKKSASIVALLLNKFKFSEMIFKRAAQELAGLGLRLTYHQGILCILNVH